MIKFNEVTRCTKFIFLFFGSLILLMLYTRAEYQEKKEVIVDSEPASQIHGSTTRVSESVRCPLVTNGEMLIESGVWEGSIIG